MITRLNVLTPCQLLVNFLPKNQRSTNMTSNYRCQGTIYVLDLEEYKAVKTFLVYIPPISPLLPTLCPWVLRNPLSSFIWCSSKLW
jgi:hypothetical protein